MKKYLLLSLVLIIACTIWFGFNRAALPEVPSICGELSKQVPLKFKIDKLSLSEIELRLAGSEDLFILFQMTGPWKTGKPGLIMKSADKTSKLAKGMTPEKYKVEKSRAGKDSEDFGQFMKDKKGKEVKSYTFNQTIVEEKSGKVFMKMAYEGPDVPMIQLLELSEQMVLPSHISKKFSKSGKVVFLPGSYRFDKAINGFYIGLDANAL